MMKPAAAKPTLTPKLRFPEFRDAEGWTPSTLGKESSILKGKGISKADIDPSGRQPCIRYGELYTHYGEIVNAVVSRTSVPAAELFLSNTDDVIIPSSGETKLDIAKASCVPWENVALGGDLNVIRSTLSGHFLSYYLNGPKRFDIARVAQGDTVAHLYPSQLENLEIAFPRRPEQHKIASCLSSLDDLIAAERQKLDALKAHKMGLMQHLFPREGETRPRLRFPEFRAGVWEVKKAGFWFANRVTKGEHGLPIYSVTMHDGMVKRDSFDRDFYDIEDAAGNKKACRNDIAYNMMRMWQGALGVAPEDCLVSPAYIVLAPLNDAVPEFFQFMFKLPASLRLLTAHSRGLTKDRLRLYYDDFARIPLPCPAPPEQHRIASCLSSLDDLIAAQGDKLEALKTHKQGLMQQLFPAPEEVGP
jgi:type I restriction enzyme S subunit